MAEVYEVSLVQRVCLGLGIVHLCTTGCLEYTLGVECHGCLVLVGRCSRTESDLPSGHLVHRIVRILVHLKSVQVGNLSGHIIVILVLELLVGQQQVVHVIRTQH